MAQQINIRWILGVLLAVMIGRTAAADLLPRKILALYDTHAYDDVFFTELHRHGEMPLNYLGMDVVYRDINAPLPPMAEMQGYRGVITWLLSKDKIQDVPVLCRWMTSQMQSGRRVVMLGRPGVVSADGQKILPECQATLQILGVKYLGNTTTERYFMEVIHKDHDMVEFEHVLAPTDDVNYAQFVPVSAAVKSYLKIRRTDIPNGESSLVFVSPHGGIAYDTFVNIDVQDLKKIHWRINPFRFFDEAFGLKGLPRPDVTTLNGSRIFYSHIDGDGIFNVSHIDQKSYSGEVIRDLLKNNPDLPVAASIITGYLSLPQYNGERERALYLSLFNLPNIEPTTHGYAHPLSWRKHTLALVIPGYIFDVKQEVQGAVALQRKLLSDLKIAKPIQLYQWTGDCLVRGDAIQSAIAADVVNMNGGDTRFDSKFDSYSFVYPLSVVQDGYRKIYSSNSNEYTFTDHWMGRFYGYGEVKATFQNTGTPRRVSPINVYYHYFSGEHLAALNAVKSAYDYVRTQRVMAIFASRFPKIVTDFYALQIQSIAGGYHVHTNGDLRTIRFDTDRRNVDMQHSKGVLGFTHDQGSLYVSLDDGRDHDVVLTAAAQTTAYLDFATFDVHNWRRDGQSLRFEKNGWMKSEMRIGGLRSNTAYRVLAGGLPGVIKSDAHGALAIVFPTSERGGRSQEVIVEPQ